MSERTEEEDVYVTMTIPNLEIRSIYRNHIRGWFDQAVKKSDKAVFYKAVLDGDTEGMEDFRTIHSMMPPGWARTEAVAGSAAEAAIVEPRRAKLPIPARRRRTQKRPQRQGRQCRGMKPPMGQRRCDNADGAAPMGRRRCDNADGTAPMGQRRCDSINGGTALMGQRGTLGLARDCLVSGKGMKGRGLPVTPADRLILVFFRNT